MVSRENTVALPFATAGPILAYGGRIATGLSGTTLIGILIIVGVVAPQLLNNHLDDRDAD
ncbi:MAG: hypothetical protein ABEJ26_00365 [Halosimplex sp.]